MTELSNWLKVIEQSPTTGWGAFYKAMLHQPVSNTETLLWAVDTYGTLIMFEAILSSGAKKFESDPLPYVLAVARSHWRNEYTRTDEDAKYERGLERSKRRTAEQNQELEERLRKVKES